MSKSEFFRFCTPILRWYSMERLYDIFFYSFTINIRKKCVTNIINVFDIISKKIETWELNHSCKGLNHSFFDFVLLFWEYCTWNWGMIYFFLASLIMNIWKKCVTNMVNVLGIIFKKCRTWVLKHSCMGPNDSFFRFYVPILDFLITRRLWTL